MNEKWFKCHKQVLPECKNVYSSMKCAAIKLKKANNLNNHKKLTSGQSLGGGQQ